jgi:phosphoglycolate phosphatase
MTKPILIFDFDGTIADSFHFILHLSNKLADEYGFRKIRDEDVEHLKEMTMWEVIDFLKVPFIKIPMILAKAKNDLFHDIADVDPVPGLDEMIRELRVRGYFMGILTSNSAQNVEKFLKNHHLDMFDFIKASPQIWGKEHCLKGLIHSLNLVQERIVYIGDEVRDVEAAHRAGVKSVAVTWGYNGTKVLSKFRPDFLIHAPQDLLKIFNGNAKNSI